MTTIFSSCFSKQVTPEEVYQFIEQQDESAKESNEEVGAAVPIEPFAQLYFDFLEKGYNVAILGGRFSRAAEVCYNRQCKVFVVEPCEKISQAFQNGLEDAHLVLSADGAYRSVGDKGKIVLLKERITEIEFSKGLDMVYAPDVLAQINPTKVRQVIQKIFASLKEGGILITALPLKPQKGAWHLPTSAYAQAMLGQFGEKIYCQGDCWCFSNRVLCIFRKRGGRKEQ